MKVSASVVIFLSFLVVAVHSYSKSEYDALIRRALNEAKAKGGIPDGIGKAQALEPVGSNFICKHYSHRPARSVHQLTPYDIKIVGAMGNSVTAGFGAAASTLLTALVEYRELSWTIGGYKDLSKVTTIPNILKKYNPSLRGYSTISKGWLFSTRYPNNNVAVSGAIAQDMPKQARRLVDKIKAATTETEFREDWKLVSLWIGGNNLCAHCKNPIKHSVANYINSIKEALDYLQNNLPRTFVNLIQIIDVTRLAPLESIICDLVHRFACSCVKGDQNIKETSHTANEYQNAINELIDTGRYNVREDFTVVVQPFFEGVELPYKNGKPDASYFALDCFHFNTKGHAKAAIALWNNMLEPVGSKSLGWEDETIHCPTEDSPYFFTGRNSKY